MRTLIRKELRENLKLALPGLLVFTALLFSSYRASATQPLLKLNILRLVELFCNALGLGLGWFQIHHEKHRDLWAFLIHRPLTRTQIFFAKASAGLGLYCLATGLPLLGLTVASAIPGRFASPFEWAMALPVGGSFLMGMVWYFAGLLTGLRRARWYASRGLGLVAALFLFMLSGIQPSGLPGFWQPFVVAAGGGTVMALAAWGAFQGGGSDRAQPAWGRRALVATLALGVILISLTSEGLLEILLLRGNDSGSAYHEITKDGTICEVIQRTGQPAEILDLAGTPLKEPQSGRKMSLANFDKLVAESYPVNVEFGDQSELRDLFQPDTRFFCLWQTTDRIRWYWRRDGELAGYDTSTRRLVGTIWPDNFPAPTARFLRPQIDADVDPDDDASPQANSSPLILATSHAVYRVNLEDRTTQILFTTTNGDLIGGARTIGDQGVIVVTRNFIQMLTMDGKSVWKEPYQSTYPGSMWVKVSRLATPPEFAVWIGPYRAANRQNRVNGRSYSRVLMISANQGLLTKIELPVASFARQKFQGLSWRLSALLMPPVPVFYLLLGWQRIPWSMMEISFGAAVACAFAGWWLGRRYHFSIGTQLGWAVFHLLGGVPGFIAFLSVQEWPAREACPDCRKMRIVERARCEHCGAGFAPPRKNGTEIFEPLAVDYQA